MLSTPVQLAEQLHSSRFSSDFIKLFFKVFCFCWNWTDSPTPLPFHSRYLNIGNIVVVRTVITYERWYEMWKHGTSSVLSTNCTLLDIMEEPFSPVWKALKANSGEKLLHLVIFSWRLNSEKQDRKEWWQFYVPLFSHTYSIKCKMSNSFGSIFKKSSLVTKVSELL